MCAYKGLEELAKMVSQQYWDYNYAAPKEETDLLCAAGEQDIPTFVQACKDVCGTKIQSILLSTADEVLDLANWSLTYEPIEEGCHERYLSASVAIDQYYAMRCLTHIARIYFPEIHRECYKMALQVRAYALLECDLYRRSESEQAHRSA